VRREVGPPRGVEGRRGVVANRSGMRRVVAVVVSAALWGSVTPSARANDAADHVSTLAAPWTCRTLRDAITRKSATQSPNEVDVENDVHPAQGAPYRLHDRYAFDPSAQVWHVRLGAGSDIELVGDAPAWTGDAWTIPMQGAGGRQARVRYEMRGAQMRRSIENLVPGGTWVLASSELCNPGSDPPAAGACINASAPARLVQRGLGGRFDIPPQTPHGVVEIIVHLRADSTIGSTTVVRTPSPYLSSAALQIIGVSTFQTAVRDCVPQESDYLFMMGFAGRRRFVIPP